MAERTERLTAELLAEETAERISWVEDAGTHARIMEELDERLRLLLTIPDGVAVERDERAQRCTTRYTALIGHRTVACVLRERDRVRVVPTATTFLTAEGAGVLAALLGLAALDAGRR